MRHSHLLIFAVIIAQLVLNAIAQYDDDVTTKKLRLQDLENEQNQRDYQRDELERLLHQQPPRHLPAPNSNSNANLNANAQRAFVDSAPNVKTSSHSVAKSVRPLEQKVTVARPMRPGTGEYVSSAASNFNFGISPLAHNGLDGEAQEGDEDTDVVSYSHDEPPLPFNLRRPQLELLSSGGAGYALASADVLVPPFRDTGSLQVSDVRRPVPELVSGPYVHPYRLNNNNRPPAPHGVNVADEASSSLGAAHFLGNNDLPEAPAGAIEYSSGYLPLNQLSPAQRPVIQYGSPHADFRRPNIYTQSNQLAYAPVRAESGSQTSGSNIPYPPSFISITTRRPGDGYNGNGVPPAVRPLGRSLGYGKSFRPSAVDPVPDFFANRQSKSLLDSYIPSWVVARMLEEQRHNRYTDPYIPYNRYVKRSDPAEARIDDFSDDVEANESVKNSKIVKKSLDKEIKADGEEMLMSP